MNEHDYLESVVYEYAELLEPYMNWCVFVVDAEEHEDKELTEKAKISWLKPSHGMIKRIAQGTVGIFLSDYSLYGYVDEARLETGEPLRHDEVNTMVETKDLFSKDTTMQEQRDLLSDLQYLHNFQMRQDIEHDFGFKYEDLTLREQLWFLEFLRDKNRDEIQPAVDFIKRFGTDGLRAFVSFEHDAGAAEKIFAIAEKIAEKQARALFNKYHELAQTAQRVDEETHVFFKETPVGLENVERRATEELMKRAGKLLSDFADGSTDAAVEEIQARLDAINKDVVLFASLFKTAFQERSGELNFDEVRGLDFKVQPAEFTPEEIAEMEVIIRKNYGGTALVDGVLKGFRGALGTENNTFYVLKKDGKIISFNRFETRQKPRDREPGVVEFASFNTDPDYQNAAIGRAMVHRTLDAQARNNIIVAETDPSSPVAQYYVNQAGFVITGAEEYKGTGIFVLSIERDDRIIYGRDSKQAVELGVDGKNAAQRVHELAQGNNVITNYFRRGKKLMGVIEQRQAA